MPTDPHQHEPLATPAVGGVAEAGPSLAAPAAGVVIPAYNAAEFLAAAIESVLAQDDPGWRLVVVDDGSTDNTARIAEDYARRDDRIRVVRQANAGRPAARNAGEAALDPGVDKVMFLDADDFIEPQCLRVLVAALDSDRRAGCVGCQYRPVDEAGRPLDRAKLRKEKSYQTRWRPGPLGLPTEMQRDDGPTPFVTFFTGSGTGPNAMFRREAFQSVGGYDTRFVVREDDDLFRKVALGWRVAYVPDELYNYRRHAGQSINQFQAFVRAGEQMDEKWGKLRPDDGAERLRLKLAEAYLRSVHQPLRCVRTGVRAVREGRIGQGAGLAARGGLAFALRWPWYLLTKHRRHARSLRAELGGPR